MSRWVGGLVGYLHVQVFRFYGHFVHGTDVSRTSEEHSGAVASLATYDVSVGECYTNSDVFSFSSPSVSS